MNNLNSVLPSWHLAIHQATAGLRSAKVKTGNTPSLIAAFICNVAINLIAKSTPQSIEAKGPCLITRKDLFASNYHTFQLPPKSNDSITPNISFILYLWHSTDQISAGYQKDWFNRTIHDIDEDSIQYTPWDPAASADFDERQAYFDSGIYQRESLEDSCRTLFIPWNGEDTIFRMPGMSLSQSLSFWHPPAVAAIIHAFLHPYLRACFLAEHVGLRKTWAVASN